MTKSSRPSRKDYSKIDVHKVLEQRRQVTVIWGIEDVQSVRPDLTDEQAWEVLLECRHLHDCELGFNWLLIDTVADDLFPAPDDTETTGAGD